MPCPFLKKYDALFLCLCGRLFCICSSIWLLSCCYCSALLFSDLKHRPQGHHLEKLAVLNGQKDKQNCAKKQATLEILNGVCHFGRNESTWNPDKWSILNECLSLPRTQELLQALKLRCRQTLAFQWKELCTLDFHINSWCAVQAHFQKHAVRKRSQINSSK